MKIEVAPVATGEEIRTIAFAIELAAFFNGEVRVDSIEWDIDPLTDWYINSEVAEEERDAYLEERQQAEDEAREATLSRLVSVFKERSKSLGAVYPLELDLENGVLLRRVENFACVPQVACYIWLALFRASHSAYECLIVDGESRSKIHSHFKNVFELIAAFSAIGQFPGYAWYLGSSRDVKKLLRRLGYVTHRVGSGVVKNIDAMDINQVNDNDGGVDVLLYRQGQVPIIHLVGATIQKQQRKNKIMGQREKERFRRFFQNNINLPLQGILAIPFEKSEVDALNCAEEDCLYFHAENIIDSLGMVSSYEPAKYRHLGLQLRDKTIGGLRDLSLDEADVIKDCFAA
ncbi:hypothetical protein [Qipengyuania sphaerica]|uniref:hypothetical protein n=1 Tax=Qipengyuania sphaerica TaxID=2867243 RepID=UPI001C87220D|nr:hypothetical protein [Qipengyuania sphaerica]MBX7540488.1 hypothetical protein [Qipengyuania sphaerica]